MATSQLCLRLKVIWIYFSFRLGFLSVKHVHQQAHGRGLYNPKRGVPIINIQLDYNSSRLGRKTFTEKEISYKLTFDLWSMGCNLIPSLQRIRINQYLHTSALFYLTWLDKVPGERCIRIVHKKILHHLVMNLAFIN